MDTDSSVDELPPSQLVSQSAQDLLFGSDSDEDSVEKNLNNDSQPATQARKALILSDDDDDDSSLDHSAIEQNSSRPLNAADVLGRGSSEEEEEDSDVDTNQSNAVIPNVVEEEEETERVINAELPFVKADLGRNMKLVKITNFLSVEPRPFDSSTYEDEAHEDEIVDEQGSTRLKLKVENTIRWRVKKGPNGEELENPVNGQPLRESNARLVRWSDGTMSLHLGREIFDIHPVDIKGNDNFLYVRQGQGLQGQGMFTQKLSFRPHSTDSITHKKITLSMATKSQNKQNVKILPIVGEDPEHNRRELLKREEEKLRASIRRENQQRRMREKQTHRELGLGFVENEEDGDTTVSVSAIKQKYSTKSPKRRRVSDIYSDSEEDSDLSDSYGKKQKRKAKILSDEDD